MKISTKGLSLIKHFEGFKANAYKCPAGVWTIGYGTTSGVKSGQVVTENLAEKFLFGDCTKFEKAVEDLVTVTLSQDQFDALVAFVYNVGTGNFKSSTLLKVLNQGHYDQVPGQMLRWNKAGGKVLEGLTRRRQSEGHLFSSGKLKFQF
jgi:lysozyme